MLLDCHKNGEVFVLQLHPERFLEIEWALVSLINKAKSVQPPMWICTLGQLAQWQQGNPQGRWPNPYQGVFCISGDIDAVAIGDFLIRLWEW